MKIGHRVFNTKSQLTQPQLDFLVNAYECIGDREGIRFCLWTFGATRTGRASARRGYIELLFPADPNVGYVLTESGRAAALEQILEDDSP